MKLKCGDIVKNGWAGKNNPTRVFLFVEHSGQYDKVLCLYGDGTLHLDQYNARDLREDPDEKFQIVGHVPLKETIVQALKDAANPSEDKECVLYLVRWNKSGETDIFNRSQIDIIRHIGDKIDEEKPCITIIRDAIADDLKAHLPKDQQAQRERDRYLKRKWNELEDIPFDEADTVSGLVLAEDWWGFQKGTDREQIWHAFDNTYSEGVVSLLYGN